MKPRMDVNRAFLVFHMEGAFFASNRPNEMPPW